MPAASTLASIATWTAAAKLAGVGPFGGGGSAPNVNTPPAPKPPEPKRAAPDLETFERPGEGAALPTFLGISSSMTPGQQLSRIATLGTSGQFGDIRSPAQGPYAGQGAGDVAKSYFRNLAIKTFTDEAGKPMSDMSLLPVYEQYLSQTLGQPALEGRSGVGHFLTRLTRA